MGISLAEVDGGSLEGPFETCDLPLGHLVSPRFGPSGGQGASSRQMSASGLNVTVGLPEKLQVDTVDEIAHGKGCKLVGRTYDLKRAYRELGVNSASFLWSAPVAFRRVALETPEWTSRDSNHHRQSVSAGKTNAIPTEPSGRLLGVNSASTVSQHLHNLFQTFRKLHVPHSGCTS